MIHIAWMVLVAANFLIQILYFRRPGRGLFIAKRVTTPLLLLGALPVIRIASGSIPLVQGLLLAAMGLGELGIEGSGVVESKDDAVPAKTPWTVTVAGALFLAVNVALGLVLIFAAPSPTVILAGTAIGLVAVGGGTWLLLRLYAVEGETRFQIILYSMGLAVLAAGAAAWLVSPGSMFAGEYRHLGLAALVLTVSDSLVLWRMGAAWSRNNPGGRRRLLVFLVVILLLYYLYIGMLISSAAPFSTSA